MPTYDATTATCLVFTYKEGLLAVSNRSHDLKLKVTRFTLMLDDDRVEATFDPRSFECVASMNGGREDPSALSDKDKRQIVENLERDVLHATRFREIRFTSTEVERDGDRWEVQGWLDLHGIKRSIEVVAEPNGHGVVARVRLHQPDFRITPFSAMLGTLKIKPDVDVVIEIPRGGS